ncbi:MAG: YdeI/OmpD-associated family protein [Bacteroidetes bacterium]|nr:YdeI/OmpD-associated family protein [Bacteroidota bacterium]
MRAQRDQLKPGVQRSMCYWIGSGKTVPTQAKRVAELLKRLETVGTGPARGRNGSRTREKPERGHSEAVSADPCGEPPKRAMCFDERNVQDGHSHQTDLRGSSEGRWLPPVGGPGSPQKPIIEIEAHARHKTIGGFACDLGAAMVRVHRFDHLFSVHRAQVDV